MTRLAWLTPFAASRPSSGTIAGTKAERAGWKNVPTEASTNAST